MDLILERVNGTAFIREKVKTGATTEANENTGSSSTILLCEAGDKVYVQLVSRGFHGFFALEILWNRTQESIHGKVLQCLEISRSIMRRRSRLERVRARRRAPRTLVLPVPATSMLDRKPS